MKTVMITGTSSGFGLECVKLFHARGWQVVATRRKLADGNPFVDLERVKLLELEMNDPNSVEQATQQAIDAFGQIDVLINNAGYAQMGPLETSSMEQVRNQFETNVFGLMALTKALIPHMRSLSDGAVIVNISSISADFGYPYFSAYAATKSAVLTLSEALNNELAAANIRVKAVLPGFHASRIFTKLDVSEKIPQVYRPLLSRFMGMQAETNGTDPAKCAEAIYQAAVDKNELQVRYYTGKDATSIPFMKRLLGLDGYYRFMRKIILNGPGALMKILTPDLGQKVEFSDKLEKWR